MNTGLFQEDMSYLEALNFFFASLKKDMDQEEFDRIKTDFDAVIPVISRRELSGNEAVLTSYPMEEIMCCKQN